MIRLGVTGTDTGVGKTVVSCALVAALVRRGLRVTAMKPIETGVSPDDRSRDGARLSLAASDRRPLSATAPITFPHPAAPVVAAQRAGREVDLEVLDAAVQRASAGYDVLLVEGAGGLLVPITRRVAYDGLFARWALDLLIVAANQLGVINHVRLTLAAARTAGLRVRGVVLNRVTGTVPDSSVDDNARVLTELERVPIVELPWMSAAHDLDQAAAVAERSGLVDLIATPTMSKTV